MVLSQAAGRRIFHCGNLASLKRRGDESLRLPGDGIGRPAAIFFKLGRWGKKFCFYDAFYMQLITIARGLKITLRHLTEGVSRDKA